MNIAINSWMSCSHASPQEVREHVYIPNHQVRIEQRYMFCSACERTHTTVQQRRRNRKRFNYAVNRKYRAAV